MKHIFHQARQCFVCGSATHQVRSITQLTNPATPIPDPVPICQNCDEDWSTGLLAIVRTDLAGLNQLANPKHPFPDNRPHPSS